MFIDIVQSYVGRHAHEIDIDKQTLIPLTHYNILHLTEYELSIAE